MSKLSGYTEDQQQRIKATLVRLVEAKVAKGVVAESDEAIRAAMPQAFMEACQVVSTVDACMFHWNHYPAEHQVRIRAIGTQLVEGQITSGQVDATEIAVRAAVRLAVEDARQTVIAVEEFLCG